MNNTAIDFAAGVTQATLVTVVGYPFDFVKAQMQVGQYKGTVDCVKTLARNGGLTIFYRGATSPWISHLMKRPIQYPVAEALKKKLPGTSNNYVIGGVTGLIGPFLGTPLQVVKVGMQTSKELTTSLYVRSIYKEYGPRGFYRGFIPTVFKDCLFGASFLGHYYTLRDYFKTYPIEHAPEWTVTFFSGAAAHCATWFLLIPIDTIKTKVQRASETRSIVAVTTDAIRTNGFRSLWRGVVPACARTIPVSGVAMVGYEFIRGQFSRDR